LKYVQDSDGRPPRRKRSFNNKNYDLDDDESLGGDPVFDHEVVQLQSQLADSQNTLMEVSRSLQAKENEFMELNCNYQIQANLLINVKENLEETKSRLEAEIGQLTSQLADARSSAADLNTECKVHEEKARLLQLDIVELESALRVAKELQNEAKTATTAAVVALKVQESIAEKAKLDVLDTKKGFEEEKSRLNARIAELTRQLKQQESILSRPSDAGVEGSKALELSVLNLKTLLHESNSKHQDLLVTVQVQENSIIAADREIASLRERFRQESNQSKSAMADLTIANKVLEDEIQKLLEEIADLKHRADIDSINAKSALVESNNHISELVVTNKVQEDQLNSAMEQIASLKEKLSKVEADIEQSRNAIPPTMEAVKTPFTPVEPVVAVSVVVDTTHPPALIVPTSNQVVATPAASENEKVVKKLSFQAEDATQPVAVQKSPKIDVNSFAVPQVNHEVSPKSDVPTPSTEVYNEKQIAQIMDRGYSREQAIAMIQQNFVDRSRQRLSSPSGATPPHMQRTPTASSTRTGPEGASLTKQSSGNARLLNLSEDDNMSVAIIMKKQKVTRNEAIQIFLQQKQQK